MYLKDFKYNRLIHQFGLGSPKSLGWSSETSQHIRFNVFTDNAPEGTTSILDVGSGYGDFYVHLREQGWNVDYMGLEPCDAFYNYAANKLGEGLFTHTNITDFSTEKSYDFVVGSGLFWIKSEQPEKEFLHTVTKMFALCNLATVFNMLNSDGKKKGSTCNYADPSRILSLVANITKHAKLIDGYHPENKDFTIILYK